MEKTDCGKVGNLLKTKTISQAAKYLGVKYQSLRSFCLRNGVEICVKGKPGVRSKLEHHIPTIVELYCQGFSQDYIAKKLGISQGAVRNLLTKGAQNFRTPSESAKMREAKSTPEERKNKTSAANAVRQALGIINFFN